MFDSEPVSGFRSIRKKAQNRFFTEFLFPKISVISAFQQRKGTAGQVGNPFGSGVLKLNFGISAVFYRGIHKKNIFHK